MLSSILSSMRINHYLKNIIVFIPLLFNFDSIEKNYIFDVFWIFISFCLVSSSIYLLNDVIDKNQDCYHPIKSERPITSGKISIKIAISLVVFLLFVSSLISFFVNKISLILILLYFFNNIFYSLFLRKIIIVDSICIAFGFILRLLSGYFVLSLIPKIYACLTIFILSIFFTFIKRKLEYRLSKEMFYKRFSVLQIEEKKINHILVIAAIFSIIIYSFYLFSLSNNYLWFTILPFSFVLLRVWGLSLKVTECDPVKFFFTDLYMIFFVISYFLLIIFNI